MKKIILLFIFLPLIIMFTSGCSASSGSLRYKNKEKPAAESESSVRFASGQNQETSTLYPDTSGLYGDEMIADDEEDIDDLPDEETSIDLAQVMSRFSSNSGENNSAPGFTSEKEKILMEIIKYLDTPYKYGGNSKNGIDCSAFTQTIYSNTLDIPLLRTARDQFTMGMVIENRENLAFGDLVFFNTRRRVRPGHVGIYIGDNLFAHASSKHGVIVSSLDHDYYSKRYMGGRRIEGTIPPGM